MVFNKEFIIKKVFAIYQQIIENTIKLIYARESLFLDQVGISLADEKEILRLLETEAEIEAFRELLIAEYKNLLYDNIFCPHFSIIDTLTMREYKRIIGENYSSNVLQNHIHNPQYFVFEKSSEYLFYREFESNGIAMIV
jgi:hypothetical protein